MTDMAESMHMAIKVSQTSGGAFWGGMEDLYERQTPFTHSVLFLPRKVFVYHTA